MSATLYWLQCGGCSGDTMSLLGAESPHLVELFRLLDLDILAHPSISAWSEKEHHELLDRVLDGTQPLDVLCVEGAVIRGPNGTGMYDTIGSQPKMQLVNALAAQARFVVAVGTCASFGGISAAGETEACGLQFLTNRSIIY